MRKSERTHHEAEHRRQWLAGRGARKPEQRASARESGRTPDPDRNPASAGGSRPVKRFVEPYQYTDTERAAIIDALAEQGLGDASAREIFVGAIAYDLALLQADDAESSEPDGTGAPSSPAASASEAEQAPGPQHLPAKSVIPGPSPLREAGENFLAQLRALDDDERTKLLQALRQSDPFDRPHDDAYLQAVAREIERVLHALQPHAPTPEPARPAATPGRKSRAQPPRHPAGLAFVRHAANVYEQCFDGPPSPKTNGSFARVLTAISKATGIPIPTKAMALKLALSER